MSIDFERAETQNITYSHFERAETQNYGLAPKMPY